MENILVLNKPVAEPISQITQEPVPTEANEPTPLPTWQPIPHGMIRVSVTGTAKKTADDLNEADRLVVDRYRLAQELRGMTPEQLATEISNENEYQINGLGEGFTCSVLAVSPTASITTMEIDCEIMFQQPSRT